MKLFLTCSITIGEETYSIGYDLGPDSIEGPLTEDKFEECYMFLKPSMAKALRDHGKIINPWG